MDNSLYSFIRIETASGYRKASLTECSVIILPELLPVKITVLGVRSVIYPGEFAIIPPGYLTAFNTSSARKLIFFDEKKVLECSDFSFLLPVLGCPLIYHPITTADDTFAGYSAYMIPELMNEDAAEVPAGASVKNLYGTLTLDRHDAIPYTAHVHLEGLRLSPLRLVNDLYAYAATKDTFCNAKCLATLISLYSILGEEILMRADRLSGEYHHTDTTFSKLNLVTDYCRAHFRENITLSQTAGQCGLAKTYLSALFKNFYSISFYDYLLRLRVLEAMRLLLTTDEAINVICKEAGFNSDTTFLRVFKSYTGVSPREFRRQPVLE
ncbi:MAG: AraC family transcriptional regulator [Clostridiales bacterium]|nr:AraC family transcriptional regulator [Clostridiales bacterium]